jgi:ACT domain-containing protein
MHPLVEKAREAGVVGAGFPAYVKYDATVDTLIANGAECEPLLIAAFGKDRPAVGAALTGVLAEHNCSIEDISQTLLQDFFSMIMVVNIEGSTVDFATLVERLKATETQLGMKVYVMHEDTFRYMHRI